MTSGWTPDLQEKLKQLNHEVEAARDELNRASADSVKSQANETAAGLHRVADGEPASKSGVRLTPSQIRVKNAGVRLAALETERRELTERLITPDEKD